MNHDINVKKMRLNCFRQSKVPGEFMLQMRVPGGMVDAKYLSYVEHIANTWGDGNFHFGTRQTFDITGIKYENIPAVNEYLEPVSYTQRPGQLHISVGQGAEHRYRTQGGHHVGEVHHLQRGVAQGEHLSLIHI